MRRALAPLTVVLAGLVARTAGASGPLEYPDNGSASFSRGGAWLAVGSDPIAAHYSPAALAIQASAVSLEANLAFNKVCFERRNPGDEYTGPTQGQETSVDPDVLQLVYRPACSSFADAPRFVPSLSISHRISKRLGVGFAIVPPAAYGSRRGEFPDVVDGYNRRTGATVKVPAPWRYMVLENDSLVLFPTLSVGYEVAPRFRVGAGFISGIASVDVSSAGIATVTPADVGDHAADDSISRFRAVDLFVPGAVASIHWSPLRNLDVAAWYRWLDAVRVRDLEVDITGRYYNPSLSGPADRCTATPYSETACAGKSVENSYAAARDSALAEQYRFVLPFPMEARAGVRWHEPRGGEPDEENRDPLRDDVWDVELDLSWTNASGAKNVEVRFPQTAEGGGLLPVLPVGRVPPNSDRDFGYTDTFGVRLGGQANVIAAKLGLLAGAWVETAALDDAHAHLQPVAALRGGFGGGIVLRQDRVDVHVGYQRHWNDGFDNGGDGVRRAAAGTVFREEIDGISEFQIGGREGENEFRSYHAINGGRVIQSANVFTLGVIYRY